MKKTFLLILAFCIVLPFNSFAQSTEENIVPEEHQISKEKINKIKSKYNLDNGLTANEREQFIELLHEQISIQQEIYLDSESSDIEKIDTLPEKVQKEKELKDKINTFKVAKLNYEDLIDLGVVENKLKVEKEKSDRTVSIASASKPIVPGATKYVNYYGLTTYVTVSNRRYEVFEIVAASKALFNSPAPLYYRGTVNLIATGSYTQEFFKQVAKVVATKANSLVYPWWYPFGFITDPNTFFGSGATQRLEVFYEAQSIYIYAYVSDGNAAYDFMQTSERLAWYEIRTAVSTKNATPKVDDIKVYNLVATSPNYANVTSPATRYANYQRLPVYYSVGDIDYYYNNVKKGRIERPYHSTIGSIPSS